MLLTRKDFSGPLKFGLSGFHCTLISHAASKVGKFISSSSHTLTGPLVVFVVFVVHEFIAILCVFTWILVGSGILKGLEMVHCESVAVYSTRGFKKKNYGVHVLNVALFFFSEVSYVLYC
jgi:hypothetical protein